MTWGRSVGEEKADQLIGTGLGQGRIKLGDQGKTLDGVQPSTGGFWTGRGQGNRGPEPQASPEEGLGEVR